MVEWHSSIGVLPAVIVTDADWVIRYVNPATIVLTGHHSSDLIGCAWSDIQHDGSTVALYRMIRDHAAVGQTWRGEVSGARRDGSIYDAAMTVAPIFDPQCGDRPMGLVSLQRDITPLKAAERLKDHFISDVSHELRTPLSIIALHSGNLATAKTGSSSTRYTRRISPRVDSRQESRAERLVYRGRRGHSALWQRLSSAEHFLNPVSVKRLRE